MTVIKRGHMILDKALFQTGRLVVRNFVIEDPIFTALAEMRVGITDHAPVWISAPQKGQERERLANRKTAVAVHPDPRESLDPKLIYSPSAHPPFEKT